MPHILVTGASGVGGRAVCRLVAEQGMEVRAADVALWADSGLSDASVKKEN